MSDINREIAEILGILQHSKVLDRAGNVICLHCGQREAKLGPVCRDAGMPDYYEDLNACHEMRQALTTQEQKVKFLNTLRGILETDLKRTVSDFDLLDAAPQFQAQAFLKVMKGKL